MNRDLERRLERLETFNAPGTTIRVLTGVARDDAAEGGAVGMNAPPDLAPGWTDPRPQPEASPVGILPGWRRR